ncbi:MAG: shikimate kinase [Patescibacteria group bacterium]
MNITLIGMAGAGKSYIGKRLAKRLGMDFIDIDSVLAQTHGKGIQEILDEVGEEAYLEKELHALVSSTSGKDNLVISPGGSIIYRKECREYIKKVSKVVHLHAPFKTVESRIRGMPPRALIGMSKKTLKELYDERTPMYEALADITINTEGKHAGGIVQEIVKFLGKK